MVFHNIEKTFQYDIVEHGYDPRTSGLWAQHASIGQNCTTNILTTNTN